MSNPDSKPPKGEKINRYQSDRKEDSANRVFKAIERLQKISGKINFTSVAKEANLSVAYLYKYPEIKLRIAELRNKQQSFPATPVAQPNSSSTGKLIASFKEKIQQIEKENKELKRKHEAFAIQILQAHHLQDELERQQQIVKDLKAMLKDQKTSGKVIPILSMKIDRVSEQIQLELESLNICLSSTLYETIKAATESTVLAAIEALKHQLSIKDISDKNAWLNKAIKGGWTKPELAQTSSKPEYPLFSANNQPSKELVSFDELSNIFNQKQ